MNNNNTDISVRTRLRSDAVRFAIVEAACVSGFVSAGRSTEKSVDSADSADSDEFADIESARIRGCVSVRRRKHFA